MKSSALTLVFLLAIGIFSGQGVARAGAFSEGTGASRLSAGEKASLLFYANNSSDKLKDVLIQAHGLGNAQANAAYFAVIKDVVMESYKHEYGDELLLRIVLNQALELTTGVPTSDGSGIQSAGVLSQVTNVDLLNQILHDSVFMAESYCQNDIAAIQAGDLSGLSYMVLAEAHLMLMRQWMTSVLDSPSIYLMELATLRQFLDTASFAAKKEQALYAEEMTKADQLLATYPAQAPQDAGSTSEYVRVLRGELKTLEARMSEKLCSEGAQRIYTGDIDTSLNRPLAVGQRVYYQGCIQYTDCADTQTGVVSAILNNGDYSLAIDDNTVVEDAPREDLYLPEGCSKGFCVGQKAYENQGPSGVFVKIIATGSDGSQLIQSTAPNSPIVNGFYADLMRSLDCYGGHCAGDKIWDIIRNQNGVIEGIYVPTLNVSDPITQENVLFYVQYDGGYVSAFQDSFELTSIGSPRWFIYKLCSGLP